MPSRMEQISPVKQKLIYARLTRLKRHQTFQIRRIFPDAMSY